jgi:hypothetical protein
MDIATSFRLNTAFSSRNTALKTSTASISVQLSRRWAITAARLHSDMLLERRTLDRIRGGENAAVAQAIVAQLVVCVLQKRRQTIYCHRLSGECPNKATGSSYTQIVVIEQDEQDEQDEQEEDDEMDE